MKYPDDSISTLGAHVGLDDIGTVCGRLRSILDETGSYRKHAYYESIAALHLELAEAMERTWQACEEILNDLPE